MIYTYLIIIIFFLFSSSFLALASLYMTLYNGGKTTAIILELRKSQRPINWRVGALLLILHHGHGGFVIVLRMAQCAQNPSLSSPCRTNEFTFMTHTTPFQIDFPMSKL